MKTELKRLFAEMQERDFSLNEMSEVLNALAEVAEKDHILYRVKKKYPCYPIQRRKSELRIAISEAENTLEHYCLDYCIEDVITFKNEIEEYEQER